MERSLDNRVGGMSPRAFQAVFMAIRIIMDMALSFAVPILAYFLRFSLLSPEVARPTQTNYLLLAYVFTALNIYFFITFGTYRPVRGRSIIDESFGVIKVVTMSTLILLAVTFFFTRFFYSRLTVIYAMLFGYILLGLSRSLVLMAERALLRRGHGLKRLLIVGTGPNFKALVEKIPERPDIGFLLAGYLEEQASQDMPRIPLMGYLDELETVVAQHGIQQIIVTLAPGFHKDVSSIVDLCDRYGIDCLVSPDLQQMIVGAHRFDEIAGIPVIRVKGLRISGLGLAVKRATDIVFSLTALTILFPFLLILSVMVRIDSRGPIFYMQKRVGMDGKVFWMFKFRSMRSGAETGIGPAWSMEKDPRVTRLGSIMRKLSIDELPQIFNVLKGEMSLVGPRPERPYFVEKFQKDVPRYMERHKVKAGMTGWAQVNGLRGDTSIQGRVQYDLYYIENWSFWFDIKIMILTVFDILKEFKFLGAKSTSPVNGAPPVNDSQPPADNNQPQESEQNQTG